MPNNSSGDGFALKFLIALIFIVLIFTVFMIDYFSIFTIKETIDRSFKSIAVNEMTKKLTDEFSSDYIARFETNDKNELEKAIKQDFISKMKSEKNYTIDITNLDIQNPSSSTITCNFTGTFDFSPMLLKGLTTFKIPVDARAKVIRLDED